MTINRPMGLLRTFLNIVKSGMEEGRWDRAPITYVKRIQPAKE
jgi:hypothetical protein